MGDSLFLGIDLGTTRVKAGLYDAQGSELGSAAVGLGSAESWYPRCVQAIRLSLEGIEPARVRAVCIGGQGPTLMPVDNRGHLVRAPIPYDDSRSIPEALLISDLLGRQVSVRSSYLPRALWIRNHEPAAYTETRWFLQAWDYLIYHLSDKAVATSPLGSYVPWQGSDIVRVSLDPERFPRHFPTGELASSVSRSAAVDTGLVEGTPLISGGGDFLLGTMGVAGARKGIAQSQGGASSAFTLCWDSVLQGEMIGWCIPSPIESDLYNAGGPITTGGVALDWLLRSVLKSSEDYGTVLDKVDKVAAGADGLLFFPYLAGEPLTLGPDARGAFVGLSLHHESKHLVRAVLEGVALAGRSILESLVAAGGRVERVAVLGGQARSRLWNQIKANVWNRMVYTPRVHHVGCLGAAAIAAAGVGAFPSLGAASKAMAQEGDCYLPDARQAAAYDRVFGVFRQVGPLNRVDFEPRVGGMEYLSPPPLPAAAPSEREGVPPGRSTRRKEIDS